MNDYARHGQQRILLCHLACLIGIALGGWLVPLKTQAQPADTISYRPPLRGFPGGREGAGSRGPGAVVPSVVVLTPKEHTGLTIHEQPVLYWYLAQETQHPVEITLIAQQGSTKPLLETRLAPPLQPGIHQVRLADHGVRLTPGVLYKWSVALVLNPQERSQDILSAGTIAREAPTDELRGQLTQADQATSARLAAREGLWYDALAALAALIDSAPKEVTWRHQRATLLSQEGLAEAADYDRQRR